MVWRHEGNSVIGWNSTSKTARVFNSSVARYEDGFIGTFRADHKHGKPQIHIGRSKDGLKWDMEDEEIHWKDEQGKVYEPAYSYDLRLVKLEDT